METRALRYFQTVAEFGSYSRGAEYLRISQPAVSRQIAKLEDELGSALFRRHGHGVTLTAAGRRQFGTERESWRHFAAAVEAVLRA